MSQLVIPSTASNVSRESVAIHAIAPCYHLRMPPPLDTTPEIEAMQIRILRSMTIEQRLQNALETSLLCREFMRAGVRNQHPDWPDKEIEREVHRLAFFPQPLPDWVG